MRATSVLAGVVVGIVFLVWKITTSGDFSESLGLGLLTGVGVEWLVAFYTQKDLEISKNDLYERSLAISEKLREMK
ncbi:MAG: hypothetical protein CMA60_00150 [Euryarchaeota archaeon]|nr:hypothetical protein [Euryarchaeota archaeon]|tara:strand:+ start:177 stop:404 length:228 start_codon:yes stop_codon:yes gene_type:complete